MPSFWRSYPPSCRIWQCDLVVYASWGDGEKTPENNSQPGMLWCCVGQSPSLMQWKVSMLNPISECRLYDKDQVPTLWELKFNCLPPLATAATEFLHSHGILCNAHHILRHLSIEPCYLTALFGSENPTLQLISTKLACGYNGCSPICNHFLQDVRIALWYRYSSDVTLTTFLHWGPVIHWKSRYT